MDKTEKMASVEYSFDELESDLTGRDKGAMRESTSVGELAGVKVYKMEMKGATTNDLIAARNAWIKIFQIAYKANHIPPARNRSGFCSRAAAIHSGDCSARV